MVFGATLPSDLHSEWLCLSHRVYAPYFLSAAAVDAGDRRSASANALSAQPVKMRSMASSAPMIHRLLTGQHIKPANQEQPDSLAPALHLKREDDMRRTREQHRHTDKEDGNDRGHQEIGEGNKRDQREHDACAQ